MLAMGALLILVTLTLNQQRAAFLVQKNAYLRELETAAADHARMRLHEITQRDFDEARIGMTSLNTTTTDLTPSLNLGPDGGETSAALFDDIDDFHNHVDTTQRMLNDELFTFRSTYTVRYVQPDGDVTLTPTLAKEFIIDVESLDFVGDSTRAIVRFQKVVAVSDYAS